MWRLGMTPRPVCHSKTPPEIIRLAAMPCVWFPLSFRNIEDLLRERRYFSRPVLKANRTASLAACGSTPVSGPAYVNMQRLVG